MSNIDYVNCEFCYLAPILDINYTYSILSFNIDGIEYWWFYWNGQKQRLHYLEFQIYVQAFDPPTDMMNHCEYRLPNHVTSFLLEKESHVHRDAEA